MKRPDGLTGMSDAAVLRPSMRRAGQAFLALGALLVLLGCSTVPPPPDGKPVDFSSIVIGSTTRDFVVQELGPPSARFEQGGVLTYRVVCNPNHTNRYVVPRRPTAGWAGVGYSLVLSFDSAGVLEKCSFAEVQEE